MAQAAHSVDLAAHGSPHRKRAVNEMIQLALALPHVKHARLAEHTDIRRLSACLGRKCRRIKKHQKALIAGLTAKHTRLKGKQMAVGIKKPLCHHTLPQHTEIYQIVPHF